VCGRKTVNRVHNVITTYGYDNKSRLTGQQTAGAVVTLTMDAVDNVLVKWYQGHASTTMTVDAASRLQTANQAGIITTFTFDGAVNQTVSHTLGRIATSTFDGENRNTKIVWANGEISTYTWLQQHAKDESGAGAAGLHDDLGRDELCRRVLKCRCELLT
jgi:hypothetical protein